MLNLKGKFTFDRHVIKKNWSKINETPLKRSGLHIRRIMRGSIRRRKKGGKPGPAGQPPRSRIKGRNAPFKLIFSVPDNHRQQVHVGMIGFGGDAIPGLHEHGGTITRNLKRKSRKGPRQVTQVAKYPERPFAGPALQKGSPKLPRFWENSIGK